VARRRLGQKDSPRDPPARTAILGIVDGKPLGYPRDNLGVRYGIFQFGAGTVHELPASAKIDPRQDGYEWLILTCDDQILHQRRGRGDDLHPQTSDVDEGPRRELEI